MTTLALFLCYEENFLEPLDSLEGSSCHNLEGTRGNNCHLLGFSWDLIESTGYKDGGGGGSLRGAKIRGPRPLRMSGLGP